MTLLALPSIVLTVSILVSTAARTMAQEPQPAPPAGAHAMATDASDQTSSQTSPVPTRSEQAGWPEPVTDRAKIGRAHV